jgi:hypothetical protein
MRPQIQRQHVPGVVVVLLERPIAVVARWYRE